ncbi:hypothetical protein [Oceanithermus profundus]
MEVETVHDPPMERLEATGVFGRTVRIREASGFLRTCGGKATGCFSEGRGAVIPRAGRGAGGGLATFPRGVRRIRKALRPVRKHCTLA